MKIFGLEVSKTNKTISSSEEPTFYPVGSTWTGATTNISKEKMLDYFLTIPELYSIITMKANMFSNMKLVNANGKETPNKYIDILNNPNFHQGRDEFIVQCRIFRQIYGNEYNYMPAPIGFPGSVKQINTLDSLRLEIEDIKIDTPLILMNEMPSFNYKYTEDGTTYPIPNTDVLHINNPVVNKGNTFAENITGLSMVSAVSTALENMKGAYESRGHIIFNRGPLTILSNDSKDGLGSAGVMDEGEKDNLQNRFSKYGLTKDQWSTIITNLPLKSQQIGANMKDLMLFEETEASFQVLLGAAGLKREIFPSVKGGTYENQKEAIKSAYTDTVIPEAEEWVGAFNNRWKLVGTQYEMKADFSHLSVFDEDLKDRGIALLQNAKALEVMLLNNGITPATFSEQCNNLLE